MGVHSRMNKQTVLFFAFAAFVFAQQSTVGYQIANAQYSVLQKSNNSTLYEIVLPEGAQYDYAPLLVDLHGSRYQMGYDYGYLLGKKVEQNQVLFLHSIMPNFAEQEALILLLDWQWKDFLSKETPQEFMEEIQGIGDGGRAAGVPDLDKIVSRFIILANMPGSPKDMIYVLINELLGSQDIEKLVELSTMANKFNDLIESGDLKLNTESCSMFGIWGNRTVNGELFSARNLDWNKDTGISHNKLVTVWHPEGKIAHASLGFAGLYGALAGMSAEGLTVHEANLEESRETFRGFPWVLRLRYVMENAKDLAEGKMVWEETNNTVGFNHMIGSAKEPVAMVIETMANYNAYFLPMDPREMNATFQLNATTPPVQIGYPMTEAVYRTNSPYDPKTREYFLWSQNPGTSNESSFHRYYDMYSCFSSYAERGIKVGYVEAINVTAIIGQKGQDVYHCQDAPEGSNVLSVTFNPINNLLWVAWENGTDTLWRAATCNTYIGLDFTTWW